MMQDRFKFRVWNKLANMMTYNFMFGNYMQISKVDYEKKYWVGVNYEPEYICFENEGIKNIEIMQCTGLKDKNGKLIFEGDIVQFYEDEFLQTMKIVWDNDEVDFKAIGLKKSVECYGKNFLYLGYIKKEDNLEVIGNIYENEEKLLCTKKKQLKKKDY